MIAASGSPPYQHPADYEYRQELQRFDGEGTDVIELALDENEVTLKQRMLAHYVSQSEIVAQFVLSPERFRPARREGFTEAKCRGYAFENLPLPLTASSLIKKFTEFDS